VALVGLGKKDSFTRKQYRKAVLAGVNAVAKTAARDAVNFLAQEPVTDTDAYYKGRLAAEAAATASYRVPAIRSSRKAPDTALRSFGVAVSERDQKAAAERGLTHGFGIAAGMKLTRDLANLPATSAPSYLAQRARNARDRRNVRVQVLGEPDTTPGVGALLSVTNGSEEPARLIVVRYQAPQQEAPVALVGRALPSIAAAFRSSSRPAWTK
jgi:leucyl aminopeptidase